MTNYEKISKKVYEILNKAGYSNKFSTFDRPERLIVEAKSDSREGILKVLKANFNNVIENDSFAGGNRIAIKVPNMWEEAKDSVKDASYDNIKVVNASSEIRQLCINNDWYTSGTNSDYSKLLRGADNGWTIRELAKDIYLHSSVMSNENVSSVESIAYVIYNYMKSRYSYLLKDSKAKDEDEKSKVEKYVGKVMTVFYIKDRAFTIASTTLPNRSTDYNEMKKWMADAQTDMKFIEGLIKKGYREEIIRRDSKKTNDSLKTFKVNGKVVRAKDEFDAVKRVKDAKVKDYDVGNELYYTLRANPKKKFKIFEGAKEIFHGTLAEYDADEWHVMEVVDTKINNKMFSGRFGNGKEYVFVIDSNKKDSVKDDYANELLAFSKELDKNNVGYTTNKEIAKAYQKNANPYMKFKVTKEGDKYKVQVVSRKTDAKNEAITIKIKDPKKMREIDLEKEDEDDIGHPIQKGLSGRIGKLK